MNSCENNNVFIEGFSEVSSLENATFSKEPILASQIHLSNCNFQRKIIISDRVTSFFCVLRQNTMITLEIISKLVSNPSSFREAQ